MIDASDGRRRTSGSSSKSSIAARCTQVADAVVPQYRGGKKSYSCTGTVARHWQAAWDGACIALGGDPQDRRR
jgi:hypothetical protein